MTPEDYDALIEPDDKTLPYKELSAKALRLAQAIGHEDTEQSQQHAAAKARAYFRRVGTLLAAEEAPSPKVEFPLPTQIAWQRRHERMTWTQIHAEWTDLRGRVKEIAGKPRSNDDVDAIYHLGLLESFIVDHWTNQHDVIATIRADWAESQRGRAAE